MALRETQQILEAIKRSAKPLICLPVGCGADAYASAIGLAHVLLKLEKQATIVSTGGPAPKITQFLNGWERIRTTLEQTERFTIELDASKIKVSELSYALQGDKLKIFLSPKNGSWSEKDMTVTASGYVYDLLMLIGAPDLESCGSLYREHPNLFFNTPIINIDHAPGNEHYGQMNAVDLTACACGEVCHDLIEAIDPGFIDEPAATAFLTGMIAQTKSFKSANLTPKSLATASRLLAKGAKQDVIIQNLYRTRSVPTLRLWGRALARLKADSKTKLAWTMLSRQDFLHAGCSEDQLPDLIDELIVSSPEAKVILVLYENERREACAILRAERPESAIRLMQNHPSPHASIKETAAGTHEEIHLLFAGQTLPQVEAVLVARIRSLLSRA